jgi:hypothetical protein
LFYTREERFERANAAAHRWYRSAHGNAMLRPWADRPEVKAHLKAYQRQWFLNMEAGVAVGQLKAIAR